MHARPELAGGSAAGGRGLQFVPALHAAAAVAASPDMHIEAAVDHPLRNLGLILSVDVRLTNVAAAVGARTRQGDVVRLIDPGRSATMCMGPMPLALLASRLLGLRRWLVLLAERRGLPLAAATFFFQRCDQLGDLLRLQTHGRLQFGNPLLQLLAARAIRASLGIHA
jgi:hypothetical protein